MPDCAHIGSLVTPFVDGELPPEQVRVLDQHLAACASCRASVAAERAVRTLIRRHRDELAVSAAPASLKARCALLASPPVPAAQFPVPSQSIRHARTRARWRERLAPLALAAAVVLAVGSAFIYQATRTSSRVLAAELAMDHEKCLRLNRLLGTQQTPQTVEASMASLFDWSVTLPDTSDHHDISLVGSRPCLYGEGKVAHIMYTYNGQLVSLFMLPRESRQDQVLEVFGHQARIWSEGDRTFVLVSRESAPGMDQMVALVRETIR